MKSIPLSGRLGRGKVVWVDDEDFPKCSAIKWHLSSTGYAVNRTKRGTTRLHRLVMHCLPDKVIDHLNGNKLDCRKANLRICTIGENARNRHGVKGITFDKTRQKWLVRYRRKYYGRYATGQEALYAYNLAKSGKEYRYKYDNPQHRQKYMLPRCVIKQGKWYGVRFAYKGKRYYKGKIATLPEAIVQRDLLLKQVKKERIGL